MTDPAVQAERDYTRSTPSGLWVPTLILLAAACFPYDGAISHGAQRLRGHVGGDVKRQLEWLQEYGQFGCIVIVALVVWLLDPPRRRRLLDLLRGVILAAVIVVPAKLLIGRPRPKFDDPGVILGPFGAYPIGPGKGIHHAWEVWRGISSDLWSMPSSHTAYAAVLSVFLAAVYPRLRWLALALVVIVGLCRVLFGSHYASDVFVGGAVGLAAGVLTIGSGQRP
ncbi:MAG: phosphatase PAP2 family protein [Phycisphaerales bacterium]|nr:phosphatase PAP2 family protein [Phycisphaerales bacterium]